MNDTTKKLTLLPYDPGILPTLPAPSSGQIVAIEMTGLPPPKDLGRSIRNRTHPQHAAFRALREAGIAAMAGRAWVFGPIEMSLIIFGPREQTSRSLADYLGGICDTLDGSSGTTFTYLPIVYEDDSQVFQASVQWVDAPEHRYELNIRII